MQKTLFFFMFLNIELNCQMFELKEEFMYNLREEIKESKKKYGITYKQLAQLIYIQPQSFTNYVNGRTEIAPYKKEIVKKYIDNIKVGKYKSELYK